MPHMIQRVFIERSLVAAVVGTATDPELAPYGPLTATFHAGIACLVAPSILFLAVRAITE